jgi:hypothetical protein
MSGARGRGSAYGPCISSTAGTPAASAPDRADGISVSTATTSAGEADLCARAIENAHPIA